MKINKSIFIASVIVFINLFPLIGFWLIEQKCGDKYDASPVELRTKLESAHIEKTMSDDIEAVRKHAVILWDGNLLFENMMDTSSEFRKIYFQGICVIGGVNILMAIALIIESKKKKL